MKAPYLNSIPSSRSTTDVFGGYNHNLRINEGEFYDMENMTSDYYPVLSPRSPRGVYANPSACTGIIAKERLCYVCGSELVIGDEYIEMGLSDEPKTLVSMGAYVIVMPDKKYINVMDTADKGDIEAAYTSGEGGAELSLWNADGSEMLDIIGGGMIPAKVEGNYWIDSSKVPYVLNTYSNTTGAWSEYENATVRIRMDGIGELFEVGDSVLVDGFGDTFKYGGSSTADGAITEVIFDEFTSDKLAALSESERKVTVIGKGEGYIQVLGLADAIINILGDVWIKATEDDDPTGMYIWSVLVPSTAISISRRMPKLDFIIESNNRLWGCRYGLAANGEFVNEIYASKLGDFKNWDSFQGIASDSWVASVGSDGPFTGAVTHGGYPLFFKENMLYKVYGSYPAEYQLSDLPCRGIAPGSSRSAAIVNEVLYYHSRGGVCAYDGSLPVCVSEAFGEVRYKNAVAGAFGNKYYFSACDGGGAWHLFAYDTVKGLWHREDGTRASAFAAHGGALYYLDGADGAIKVIGGSEYGCAAVERKVKWYADTGIIGTDSPDKKYIMKLGVRLMLDIGSWVRFFVEYDSSGAWEPMASIMGNKIESFTLPIIPHRCDHLRLRIEGEGAAKIFSITKTVREGSER